MITLISFPLQAKFVLSLKGHVNEADFLGFLQKLVPLRLSDLASRGVDNSPTRLVGESAFECLKENSASRRLPDSPSRGV